MLVRCFTGDLKISPISEVTSNKIIRKFSTSKASTMAMNEEF